VTENPKEDPTLDIDALLASVPPEETPVEAPAPAAEAPVEETETQRKIRELQEELAAPMPEPETPQLSEEERLLRDLEDKAARRRAEIQSRNAPQYSAAVDDDREKILIHVLTDGFTACGQIWFRGQEIEFPIGSPEHEQQLDREGRSWLDLRDDVAGQYQRYGTQMFASGPWPGRAWDDFSHLTDPEEIRDAEMAARAERARNRRAPLI
jgi:hypothetical protein